MSSSHSHQEATLAIGDATTVMGGQVRGDLEEGGLCWGRGLFLLGSEAGLELVGCRKSISAIIQKGANKVSSMCLRYANSKSLLFLFLHLFGPCSRLGFYSFIHTFIKGVGHKRRYQGKAELSFPLGESGGWGVRS